MQQVLREVGFSNTNFSSIDTFSGNKCQAAHERNLGLENCLPEEQDHEKPPEGTRSGEENVSQLDYGARDECHIDGNSGTWSEMDSDLLPRFTRLSEDLFKSSEAEEAVLEHLPNMIIPSVSSDPPLSETCNHIVAALRAASASENHDMTAIQEILGSEDLPASLREAYPHSLVSSVYDVMLRHRTSTEAQALGAQFLQKIAIHVPNAANEIGEGNGIQLIMHSMLLNKGCLVVQTAAAAALAALCSTSQNRLIAGKFYAVETIVGATREFNEEKYLQGACMKLLTALALEPENSDVIVNAKSIRLPFRVIKRHKQTRILVRLACECAHQLLKSFDETDIEEVAQWNPIKIFMSALLGYPDDERIQVTGIECMNVFCSANAACLLTCVNSRATGLCVRNMKMFRGSRHGRLHLTSMQLLCLFAEAGYYKVVASAGALEGCLTLMIEMRRVFAIQICCLRLLELVVASGEESLLLRIISNGGLEVLNESLKAYISREEFVDRGVKVMRAMRG